VKNSKSHRLIKAIYTTAYLLVMLFQVYLCDSFAQADLKTNFPNRTPYDFDGDHKADLSLYNNGTWRIFYSSREREASFNFGTAGDIPVPQFYLDPAVACNIAVWRPANSFWYISGDYGNTYQSTQFGISTDRPVPMDYDNDQKADIAVFRNGVWFILKSSNNTLAVKFWGASGDIPVPGFYTFQGGLNLAVYRPTNSTWYLLKDGDVPAAYQFGAIGDQIVPEDYNGDGIVDLAVFRPSAGTWYVWESYLNTYQTVKAFNFGLGTDIPVPADYDNIGGANIAVYRPSNQFWYILGADFETLTGIQFGSRGDVPVPNTSYR
jgi:hypothetical protein